MKIIQDLKLDFDDVLIKPKRSNLKSRSEVILTREFSFPHSSRSLSCIPIFAANMDTTGSMQMADTLTEFNCCTCLHKHYPNKELIQYFKEYKPLAFYSTGISSTDIKKLTGVFDKLEKKPNICVDVANGYSENFVKVTKQLRTLYPDIIIMAGNVVTPEMVEELIFHGGVDIVKVGIGSGSYWFNELVTGNRSNASARVKRWDLDTKILQVGIETGTFLRGETVTGSRSGAQYVLSVGIANTVSDKYDHSNEIEDEADQILDFTESNPFGLF